MKNTDAHTLGDRLIENMKKAMGELEEFRLQLALGKMEARDFFESAKNNLRQKIETLKTELGKLKEQPEMRHVLNAFEQLQVQLALGIAESEEIFENQRKKIAAALHELETSVKNNPHLKEEYGKIQLEIEKFRIKMELLSLRFRLKKAGAEFNFSERKKEFAEKMEEFKTRFSQKEKEAAQKWEHFQDEMSKAFSHFKSAFRD